MDQDLRYWLSINKIPNVGPVTVKKLWDHFGSIRSAWKAEEIDIFKIEGINKAAVRSFVENRNKINLEEELEKIEKNAIGALTLEDEDYPKALKHIYDPPPVLFYKGDILRSDEKAIAIVGTRKASRYGLEIASKLAFEIASMGITVVSGLASGIDTSAHKGAIASKGRTFAVFGCGVDVIFPAENRKLAKEIESAGAIISEFPIGAPTDRRNFPRRNRIISGLSLGVIVVEGHYDSGAMITAKSALDQGREVFAVPGNIELEQSKGPHWLIKQGAKLVESVDDVLEELNIFRPAMTNDPLDIARGQMTNEGKDYSSLTEDEKKIVEVLSREPKYIDNIALEAKMATHQASSLLMMLEVKMIVRRLPGNMFVLY